MGLYAIQIAALHGLKVVTTCSPRHFDHVRAVGAAHAFDYNDANVVESIKKAAPGLKYFFDTIGSETSSTKGSEALDEQGGTMCTVRPNKAFTDNVSKQTKVTPVLMWTSLYEGFHFRETYWPVSAQRPSCSTTTS